MLFPVVKANQIKTSQGHGQARTHIHTKPGTHVEQGKRNGEKAIKHIHTQGAAHTEERM